MFLGVRMQQAGRGQGGGSHGPQVGWIGKEESLGWGWGDAGLLPHRVVVVVC